MLPKPHYVTNVFKEHLRAFAASQSVIFDYVMPEAKALEDRDRSIHKNSS